MNGRPDYTMTWDVTFFINGKEESFTFLTDDFEDVYAEYLRLKSQYESVIFSKHELHRKGKLIVSPEMMEIPV